MPVLSKQFLVVASDTVHLINGLNILVFFRSRENKGHGLKGLTNTFYPCGTMLEKVDNLCRKLLCEN